MAGARPGELFGCCAAVRCRAPELVATFEFTATDAGSAVTAIECSLDGSAFAACVPE